MIYALKTRQNSLNVLFRCFWREFVLKESNVVVETQVWCLINGIFQICNTSQVKGEANLVGSRWVDNRQIRRAHAALIHHLYTIPPTHRAMDFLISRRNGYVSSYGHFRSWIWYFFGLCSRTTPHANTPHRSSPQHTTHGRRTRRTAAHNTQHSCEVYGDGDAFLRAFLSCGCLPLSWCVKGLSTERKRSPNKNANVFS